MGTNPVTKEMNDITDSDQPFLPPIEDPQDPTMKQAYEMARSYMGKVPTPLKVFSARMPPSFNQFAMKIAELDRELTIPPETAMLVRAQVARINVCLFCMDAQRAAAIAAKMNEAKFDALDQYSTSPLFTEGERSVLDYVTELTRDKKVNPVKFSRTARHYSERQICEIVYLVAREHVYNMTNIGLNIHSDMLCKIPQRK